MKSKVTANRRTGRIEKLTMEAESFPEQRILRLLVDGMMDDKIQFSAALDGEPAGVFSFGKGQVLPGGE